MRDWAHSRRLGTPADEAGYVFPRQPQASKLANLFRIDVRDHALGLVTYQLGGRVTEHPPAGWLGPRTPSLREGPGSASVPMWFSRSGLRRACLWGLEPETAEAVKKRDFVSRLAGFRKGGYIRVSSTRMPESRSAIGFRHCTATSLADMTRDALHPA